MSHSTPSINKRKATVLLGQELKCKNGCGYYGNPEWQGYCSKCHRELNLKVKPERDSKGPSKKVVRSYSDAQDNSISLGFSKFEEKKKQQSEKRSKTIKSIIKRGHTSRESTTHSPSRDLFHIGEFSQLSKDLQLKDPAAKDVIKQIQKQLDLMSKHYDKSIDEQSEVMQDFYNFMFNRCETHPYYQDITPEEIDRLMDKIEEQLMIHLHRSVFQQISSEYEEKDLALQKRIRSLNWITAQRLGLDIKESSPDVRDLIDKAITDVIEMDSKIAPQEKINSIVKCSKNIFNLINMCQRVIASADEFLPAMVYIVLKANPPLLQSNIKYITSYSIPTRLRSGEGAYYFTNLCCAVAFIEGLTSESLNLSNEEFQRYISGEVPLDYAEQNASDCEGLRRMSQNLAALTEIQEKSNQVLNEVIALRDDMAKFEESILKCKPASTLMISQTPYTVPAHVDMSLIPEALRSRVVCEEAKEDILVDIGNKIEQPQTVKHENEEHVISTPLDSTALYNFSDSNALADFHNISLESQSKILPSDVPVSNIPVMQPMQVILPSQKTLSDNGGQSTSSSPLVQNSSIILPVQDNISQQVLNIKDLEYPTEIFPEGKGDENLEFESYATSKPANPVDFMNDVSDSNAKCFIDPLSPESGFMEENLHLPPPLQPVVVQSSNLESSDKKS